MSTQLFGHTATAHELFVRLNRLLVESNETTCGLIVTRRVLDENGLNRLKNDVTKTEASREAQVVYEAASGLLAILLPDQKLSDTHYVSLSVKRLLQGDGPGGALVIAGFPECGVPKEADMLAMQDMLTGEADQDGAILIYNQPEQSRQSFTILIVDEDETACELLDSRLRLKGYEVFKATNGLDGLRLFDALRPDLVITELSLTALGGYELIRAIRGRKEAGGTCGILVLSENRVERDISACFELGVSDYIKKPFSPIELEARVRRLLEREVRLA
ncbi:response regulator transcription factor [Paenibacillus sp. GYB003]|uniref:response regulator transcription factor n=1 Tax=Paenibacillus sp. GYB003 TaxID=2994392 RepID=UPI002F968B9C